MKSKSRTKWLGIVILMMALCIVFWQVARNSGHDKRGGGSQGLKPDSHGPSNSSGTGDVETGPTVEVSGLGKLPYKDVEKQKDLSEVMNGCGALLDGELAFRKENGIVSPADVYTNEKGEIVHLSFQKGKYKTKSRDAEIIAEITRLNNPYGCSFEIVGYGIPNLSMDASDALRNLLSRSGIDTAFPGSNSWEIEITPVIARITGTPAHLSKYIGKTYPMFLQKFSKGSPSENDDYSEDVNYLKYSPSELVVRKWSMQAFLPDPEAADGRSPIVGFSHNYLEPLLEAWEEHKAEKEKGRRNKKP